MEIAAHAVFLIGLEPFVTVGALRCAMKHDSPQESDIISDCAGGEVPEYKSRAPRDIRDGPWCYQVKSVVRRIRDLSETTHDVSSALALYLALTEAASDEGAPTFTRRVAELATLAGLRYRKSEILLARFEQAGLIGVQRNFMLGTQSRLPSTYTLFALGIENATSLTECSTLRTERNQSVPIEEEQRNKRNKHLSTEEASEAKVSVSNAAKVNGKASAKRAEGIPFVEVVDRFHQLCPSLPKLQSLTKGRRSSIACRWRAAGTEGIAHFEQLFRAAQASDFLSGRNGKWRGCSFDWLLKQSNAQKVLEGNYTNKSHANQSQNSSVHGLVPGGQW